MSPCIMPGLSLAEPFSQRSVLSYLQICTQVPKSGFSGGQMEEFVLMTQRARARLENTAFPESTIIILTIKYK